MSACHTADHPPLRGIEPAGVQARIGKAQWLMLCPTRYARVAIKTVGSAIAVPLGTRTNGQVLATLAAGSSAFQSNGHS